MSRQPGAQAPVRSRTNPTGPSENHPVEPPTTPKPRSGGAAPLQGHALRPRRRGCDLRRDPGRPRAVAGRGRVARASAARQRAGRAMTRRAALLLGAVLAAFAVPGTASAATVGVAGGTLTYTAASG